MRQLPSKQPRVSIIITSYSLERLKDLCELLDSVKNQTYNNLETIVVAEGSDELLDRIGEYVSRKRMRNVQVLFNDGKSGLSEGRNLGITKATGEILAFADDDVVLASDWAEEIAKTFSNNESVIGLTGSAAPLADDNSATWLPKELDWLLSCTGWCEWKEIRDVRNVWGMNMAFAKEAFQRCGLFPTTLGYHRGPMAEDIGFSMIVKTKTRKRIVFNPMVKVLHKVHGRLSWSFIAERAYWIGHSRRMIKVYFTEGSDDDVLSSEWELLHRIFTRLPKLFDSISGFTVTMLVLSCVGLGYLLPGLSPSREASPKHRAS
jgi:glycosyltransferase involved in cell wall biosynthesis